jgi:hypothetical protein
MDWSVYVDIDFDNIATELINALPRNDSINTVQKATIEQRIYATRF